ncbi:MAG: NUDIX hydrolase [Armatimonadota bacterium]|jgi:8-oxo-dGTP pyrophosphatase MutT (NUDIX family)
MRVLRTIVRVDEDYFDYMAARKGSRSEVVMILPRPAGKVLTLTKKFYPDGLYNLPSGRMEVGESYREAFAREVAEETGLDATFESVIGRIDHTITCDKGQMNFTSYLILAAESSLVPRPSDSSEQIAGYRDASADDLRALAQQMKSLHGKWRSFGRFRATALEFTADSLAKSLDSSN